VSVDRIRLLGVSPTINTEDLIDAHGVAHILGLSHFQSVSTYQRRYPDMPRPAVDLGPGRPRLWLRSEIALWARKRTGANLDG
jgi:predicted DNA-binding transcriptional regulator AlpA